MPPDFFNLFAFFKTGSARFDKVEIHGLMLLFDFRITGSHDDKVAVDAVADKGLLAVEHYMITIFHGRCFHFGQIAARVWLCHGNRRDNIAGNAAGQIFALLFL